MKGICRSARYAAAALLVLALSACGTATFIRGETAGFVTAANKVVGESKAFYTATVQSDNDFYAIVVATSPSCPVPDLVSGTGVPRFPEVAVYFNKGIAELYEENSLNFDGEAACSSYRSSLMPFKAKDSWAAAEERYRRAKAGLCMPKVERDCLASLPAGLRPQAARTFQPVPLGIEAFAVELATLEAISEYLAALEKLSKDPTSQVDEHLAKAVEKVEEIQGYLKQDWIDADLKKRQTAVGGLLSTLRELYKSAKQAKKIVDELDKRSGEISSQLAQLAQLSDATYKQLFMFSTELRVTRLKNYLERTETLQSFSDRQKAIEQYRNDALILRSAYEGQAKAGAEVSPTGVALRGVIKAQDDLIASIKNPTDKQKAQIAALSRKNFASVLKGFYGVLGAFGVL